MTSMRITSTRVSLNQQVLCLAAGILRKAGNLLDLVETCCKCELEILAVLIFSNNGRVDAGNIHELH